MTGLEETVVSLLFLSAPFLTVVPSIRNVGAHDCCIVSAFLRNRLVNKVILGIGNNIVFVINTDELHFAYLDGGVANCVGIEMILF